jgi:hypothetical protein
VPLADNTVSRLRGLLREVFPERLLSVPQRCIDGLPFEVTVQRRNPALEVRARCNLGDGLGLLRERVSSADRSWIEWADCAAAAGQPLPPVYLVGFLLISVSIR